MCVVQSKKKIRSRYPKRGLFTVENILTGRCVKQGGTSSATKDDSSSEGAHSKSDAEGGSASSGGVSDAARLAAENARRQGQEALGKVADAARSAASFASGVAGELFRGAPIPGASKSESDDRSGSAGGTQGDSGTSGSLLRAYQ